MVHFGLRNLAEQINEKVKSRQEQLNKIRIEIMEMEKSQAYQAIQKHKICSKQLQDLTSAFQSLRMKYRKNDDEQLAWKTHHTVAHNNNYHQSQILQNINNNILPNQQILNPPPYYGHHPNQIPSQQQPIRQTAPNQSSINNNNNNFFDQNQFQPYREGNLISHVESGSVTSEASSVKESLRK